MTGEHRLIARHAGFVERAGPSQATPRVKSKMQHSWNKYVSCSIVGALLISCALVAAWLVQKRHKLARERERVTKVAVLQAVHNDLYHWSQRNGRLPAVVMTCEACGKMHSWQRFVLAPMEGAGKGISANSALCSMSSSRYSVSGIPNQSDVAAVAGPDTAFDGDKELALDRLPKSLVVAILATGEFGDLDNRHDLVVSGEGGSDLGLSDFERMLTTQEVGIVFADGSIWILRQGTPLAVIQPLLTRSRSSDSARARLASYALRRY